MSSFSTHFFEIQQSYLWIRLKNHHCKVRLCVTNKLLNWMEEQNAWNGIFYYKWFALGSLFHPQRNNPTAFVYWCKCMHDGLPALLRRIWFFLQWLWTVHFAYNHRSYSSWLLGPFLSDKKEKRFHWKMITKNASARRLWLCRLMCLFLWESYPNPGCALWNTKFFRKAKLYPYCIFKGDVAINYL